MERISVDSSALVGRLREMVATGRLTAARPLLSALKVRAGGDAEVAELEARILVREQRAPDALAVLDAAIDTHEDARALHLCRSEVRLQEKDFWGAADDAAKAVMLDRTDPLAKAMLGVTLIELGQFKDAVSCLGEACHAVPDNVSFRRGLSAALEGGGDRDSAAGVIAEGVLRRPMDAGLRVAGVMIEMRRRDFVAAARLAAVAIAQGIADASLFGLLGHALSSQGRHDEAGDAYREALKLCPEDPYVRHLVASAGVVSQAERAPNEYLETVFDGYAQRFEAHLISLGYRVPGLVRAAVLEVMPGAAEGAPIGPVLDLGCGTGLVGLVLGDLNLVRLVGVDASSGMLEEAKAKNLYAELLHEDLELTLSRVEEDWQAIIAGDVFCYFGAIDTALKLAHARLRPGGYMIFSVEALRASEAQGEPWRLGRQGRYSHTEGYIRGAVEAAGFEVTTLRDEVLRFEGDAPVEGLLVVARRVQHDG